jgi:Flp pilus assembly pilin Flp
MVKNQQGQTLVEYILILAVATSLVVTFYRSQTFQKLFGENGSVGRMFKLESEFGYRHAFINGRNLESNVPYTNASEHPSYYNKAKGETRFFGASDPYQ